MHPNPTFRKTGSARTLDFARTRGFGLLVLNGPDVPLTASVPFLLSGDGTTALLHLVRSNPITRHLVDGGQAAKIVVSGPDAYVSPDWYGIEDQVPTWNYVAVHLFGRLERLDPSALRGVIDDTSAHFENALAPKPVWTSAKMTPDTLDRMMRQIVPFRFIVTEAEATWKLGQNKPDDVRLRAADEMRNSAIGLDPVSLARLMRTAGEAG